jgi:hypothetical protein
MEKHFEIKYKQTNKMAELKGLWAFLNILGYTTYVYALFVSFANVDVFTRTVLGFVGLVFLVAKLIVFCVAAKRKHLMENLDIREKRNNEREREVAIREREIAAYEKENAIIRGYDNT